MGSCEGHMIKNSMSFSEIASGITAIVIASITVHQLAEKDNDNESIFPYIFLFIITAIWAYWFVFGIFYGIELFFEWITE